MAFTRVRFFAGQVLSAADFEAEQTYQREKRQLHNRLLHRPGVVTGLELSLDGEGSPAVIVVAPGFAIDPLGNEIVVDQAVRLPAGNCTGEFCFVTLSYTETPAAPVPTDRGEEFGRVIEGFTVELRESKDGNVLVLARLVCRRDGIELG